MRLESLQPVVVWTVRERFVRSASAAWSLEATTDQKGGSKRAVRRPGALFPARQPYRTGRLRVSSLHTLYYKEYGNPAGKPLGFLHGGPGAGISPGHRRFFDPRRWRVVLFD